MSNPLKSFEKSGYIITYLPVDKHGVVNPDDVKKAIPPTTIMVSIMYANGEIGTIEPVKEIGAITREKGICFHTDAVAAAGNIPIDINEAHIDALSISANQFYGPAGGWSALCKGLGKDTSLHGGRRAGRRPQGGHGKYHHLLVLVSTIPGTMLNTFWKNCHLPLNASGRCHLSITKCKREINPKI